MGWSGGYEIFDDMITAIDHIKCDESEKTAFTVSLIRSLENKDWDGLGDMDIDELPRWAKLAVAQLYPDWGVIVYKQ